MQQDTMFLNCGRPIQGTLITRDLNWKKIK